MSLTLSRTFFALIVAATALAAPAINATDANARDAVVTAFDRRDYARAHQLAKPAAEAGDAVAQYWLGVMLRNGLSVEKNPAAASEWFARAAAQKNDHALTDLAALYLDGEGVERDAPRAVVLLTQAAELGNATAQFKLGQAYQHGTGVRKSIVHARYWYERADASEVAVAALTAGPSPSPRTLPDSCKPKSPPVRAMSFARVKEFSGFIHAYIDGEGRVRGVTSNNISVDDLKYDAVAWFSEALRAPDCKLPVTTRGYGMRIPFKFVLQ